MHAVDWMSCDSFMCLQFFHWKMLNSKRVEHLVQVAKHMPLSMISFRHYFFFFSRPTAEKKIALFFSLLTVDLICCFVELIASQPEPVEKRERNRWICLLSSKSIGSETKKEFERDNDRTGWLNKSTCFFLPLPQSQPFLSWANASALSTSNTCHVHKSILKQDLLIVWAVCLCVCMILNCIDTDIEAKI